MHSDLVPNDRDREVAERVWQKLGCPGHMRPSIAIISEALAAAEQRGRAEREAEIVAVLRAKAVNLNKKGDDVDNQWRSADYNHASNLAEAISTIESGGSTVASSVIWPEDEPHLAICTANPIRKWWHGLRASLRGKRLRVLSDDMDGPVDPVFVARFCERAMLAEKERRNETA